MCQQKMRIRNSFRIFAVGLMLSSGSFVMGYQLVSTSMISSRFQQNNALDDKQIDYYLSLITSMLPFGAIIGSFLYRPLCQRFNQRKTTILIDILAIVAMCMQMHSMSIVVMCISRFILGFFCGISSGITPTYLNSVSTPEISGIIGSLNQIMITIGIASAYAMGQIFAAPKQFTMNTLQDIYLGYPIILCLIRMLGLMLAFPFETIETHLANNQTNKIQEYLNYLYIFGTVEQLSKIKKIPEKHVTQVNYQQIQSSKQIKYVVLVVVIINQFSGINAILFYAKQLFSKILQGNVDSSVLNLGLFQVVITIISGMLLDKVGRKFMMLLGGSIIVFSLLMGYVFYDLLHSNFIMVGVVFLHIFGFSLSLGPVTMVYISELMSDISLPVIVLWFLTMFVASISQLMIVTLGIGKTFLIYGIISGMCLLYLQQQMIETKGLTYKQIFNKFAKRKSLTIQDERISLKQQIIDQNS